MKDFIISEFMKGFDCGQVVVSHFAEKLGITDEVAKKMSAGFGAGMFNSDKCGAVTGAYIVLGLKYGHYKDNDEEQKNILVSKIKHFDSEFKKFQESDICKDMLKADIMVEQEKQKLIETGVLFDLCPKAVQKSIEILQEMI